MITNALDLPLGDVTPTDGNLLVGNTGVWQTTTMSGAGTLNASGVLTVDLASPQVTGVLPIANGGTNSNTQTTNGVAFYNGTSIVTSDALIFDAGSNVLTITSASSTGVSAICSIVTPPDRAFFTASRLSSSDSAQFNFETNLVNDWTLGTGIGTSPSTSDLVITDNNNAHTDFIITAGANEGNVLKPRSSNFVATLSSASTNATGNGATYTFGSGGNVTVTDYNSNIGAGTAVFTAPVTGVYQLSAVVNLTGLDATNTSVVIQFNLSTPGTVLLLTINPSITIQVGGELALNGNTRVPLTAGTVVSLQIIVGGVAQTVTVDLGSTFSGFLIG